MAYGAELGGLLGVIYGRKARIRELIIDENVRHRLTIEKLRDDLDLVLAELPPGAAVLSGDASVIATETRP